MNFHPLILQDQQGTSFNKLTYLSFECYKWMALLQFRRFPFQNVGTNSEVVLLLEIL